MHIIVSLIWNCIQYSFLKVNYIEKIIENHCEFWHNRPATDQIFSIRQELGEKMGVQLDGTSAICRLEGNLWFS
jgi:hypothetical protein